MVNDDTFRADLIVKSRKSTLIFVVGIICCVFPIGEISVIYDLKFMLEVVRSVVFSSTFRFLRAF